MKKTPFNDLIKPVAIVLILAAVQSCGKQEFVFSPPRERSTNAYQIDIENDSTVFPGEGRTSTLFMYQDTRVLPGGEIGISYEIRDAMQKKVNQYVQRFTADGQLSTGQGGTVPGLEPAITDNSWFWHETWWVGKSVQRRQRFDRDGMSIDSITTLYAEGLKDGIATLRVTSSAVVVPDRSTLGANVYTDLKMESISTGIVKVVLQGTIITRAEIESRTHGTAIFANDPLKDARNISLTNLLRVSLLDDRPTDQVRSSAGEGPGQNSLFSQ